MAQDMQGNNKFSVSIDDALPHSESGLFDDDGRPKRTGTLWTTSAHVITATIGCGVLALAWAVAQLGWIAGPVLMIMFAFINYYSSYLLADCYRIGNPMTGNRNYTYMDAVQSYLGGFKVKLCGLVQYLYLFGLCVGYNIATAISMMAIHRSNCFHKSGRKDLCHTAGNPYMILFGVIEILLSQIPDIHQIWWLSVIAAVMSFTYSFIGLGLPAAKIAETGVLKGSLIGKTTGSIDQKIWRDLQAIGNIAISFSYIFILVEVQDTIKSPPPSEATTMKKANLISIMVTTSFYMLCACLGYAAVGDSAPGNLLTGFAFYEPFWLLDIANIAVVIHLIGAYQVFSQPIFAFIEKWATDKFPNKKLITNETRIPFPGFGLYKLNLFRLVLRTLYVVITTIIAMLLPLFNDVLGVIGALGFWPLTVYFPFEMYIARTKVPRWSARWICLRLLSLFCLIISISSGVGSIIGVITDLQEFKPFKIKY